jgi:uridine kinase
MDTLIIHISGASGSGKTTLGSKKPSNRRKTLKNYL